MLVTWDPAKARVNRRKHGIAFPDAESVLFDPYALTREDVTAEGEQRHVTIGMDALGRLVVVAFTYRDDTTRIISARKATRRERTSYEAGV